MIINNTKNYLTGRSAYPSKENDTDNRLNQKVSCGKGYENILRLLKEKEKKGDTQSCLTDEEWAEIKYGHQIYIGIMEENMRLTVDSDRSHGRMLPLSRSWR